MAFAPQRPDDGTSDATCWEYFTGMKQELRATFLRDEEIRQFSRDLRILLATNGTLTRILSILANEEVIAQVVNQDIHDSAPEATDPERFPKRRTIHRQVLLKGRSSGKLLVVAESLTSVDLAPSEFIENLTEISYPVGELLLANRIEAFKETPKFWTCALPDWLDVDEYPNLSRQAVARRYRVIISGQPAIAITEYFPESIFACSTKTVMGASDDHAALDMGISERCHEGSIQQETPVC
ncbi:chorismate--pyruvate lyase family protein [Mycobacterium lacus]|uniref:Chorismate pyruvate-lyase n=1 Tax=Mycobacterium lacus TaxID=169765 RepID=A0A7I7NJB3_9MYCO|nr:chorismate pyruvate-lyase family protein [Mycobacterium lacus]MCV7125822.1 DUF98 domain-containing protein [Mycobacterium lacus]BBX96732.1 hypothetical protein MLAC_20260 [Mycobacterium lacus]